MNHIKVSIALITYNRPHYLKLAIEAILNQTYKDFELIIMDNASTKETFELIQPYLNEQIKYQRNSSNTRDWVNKAFSFATGDYLLITHDDDMMKPTMLEKEVEALDSNSNSILVACNITLINGVGDIIKEKYFDINSNLNFKKLEFINNYFSSRFFLPCPTVLMNRNLINKFNLRFSLEAGPASDTLFWFEANALPYEILFLDEPLYNYRDHPSQDSKDAIYQEPVFLKYFINNLFLTIKDELPDYTKINLVTSWLKQLLRQFYEHQLTVGQIDSQYSIIKDFLHDNKLSNYTLRLTIWMRFQILFLGTKRLINKLRH